MAGVSFSFAHPVCRSGSKDLPELKFFKDIICPDPETIKQPNNQNEEVEMDQEEECDCIEVDCEKLHV
ncbi:hypothetical protein ABEB36_003651 [Hypothenemus hampei]|uniref:Uncharacterized protein n=1 Tax=Hypothenemus hampei TaxID=57062 RepID=A0ABD1FBQ3_HYPHA